MKMGDQDVFTTPEQNNLAAKALMDSIEPLLGENNAASPIAARVKAMVTAVVIQQHEEAARTHSASRATSSLHPTNQDWDRGSKYKGGDARSYINHSRDASDIINVKRREREDEEQRWCNDEQERFSISNDRQH